VNTLAHNDVELVWRGALENDELNDLHAEAFGEARVDRDWASRLTTLSLGWVTARDDAELVGFVNVAWDGMVHAFVLDLAVAGQARHLGVASALIRVARDQACAAGCEWLHVDFEERLSDFYFGACGFLRTSAGLIALQPTKQ
jgi:ribosomal protein S18 acetylase RimI-like enzyme